MRVLSPFVLLLAGCASDSREVSARQQALDDEIVKLEAEIRALRKELAAAGVAGGKRRKGKRRPQSTARDLSAELTVQATRDGAPPALPDLAAPEPTRDCGHRFQVPTLRGISDYQLTKQGLGKASPLLLRMDGQPLAPHAFPTDYEQRCGSAFRHAGTAVLFSGAEPDLTGHRFDLVLDDRVPMPSGSNDRPIYWAWPGSTLEIVIGGEWDEAWGTPSIELAGWSVGPGNVTGELAGNPVRGSGAIRWNATPEGDPPWTISLRPDVDGPYVALQNLTVGNAEHALVVTGSGDGAGK